MYASISNQIPKDKRLLISIPNFSTFHQSSITEKITDTESQNTYREKKKMGSRCDNQTLHNKHFHQKTIFLPMFCRLSIKKDIKVNNHHKDQTSVEEPASPKVSCIGQVKRNNRVIGHRTNTYHLKLTNQKTLFSGKTILPTTTNNGARSAIRSCRTNAETWASNHQNIILKTNGRGEDCVKVVNIGDLDPPLPVVQRAAPPLGVSEDEINIWKRRCNGVALRHLQIQQIHLPNKKFLAPPSV